MDLNFIRRCVTVYGNNMSIEQLLLTLSTVEYLNIYTDGATQFNGVSRISGIGVYFNDNDERNLAKLVDTTDNNECEIMACIEALNIVKDSHQFIHILTDSRLIVDRMNRISRKNKCEKLFIQLDILSSSFLDIKYTYVKGHIDIKGNLEADALSRSLF